MLCKFTIIFFITFSNFTCKPEVCFAPIIPFIVLKSYLDDDQNINKADTKVGQYMDA